MFIDVTDNGNAAGFVRVTLPLTARVGSTYFCARRADAISGKMPQGVIRDQDIGLVAYDNTYPATGNGHLVFSGSYEVSCRACARPQIFADGVHAYHGDGDLGFVQRRIKCDGPGGNAIDHIGRAQDAA